MIQQVAAMFGGLHANIYRVGVYRNGEYREQELQCSSPCHNIYSISKNFTATAVGIARARGLVDFEAPIIRYLGKFLPGNYDPRYAEVRVKHLLNQTTGIAKGSLFEADRYATDDRNWITRVLSRPLVYAPGEKFAYDNGNYYMLACIVEQASRMPLTDFLQENLFDTMGIHEYAWERCPMGHCMGATGLYMRLEDICKLGSLYLEDGRWNGSQLLPENWIAESTAPLVMSDIGMAYGYSFWLCGGGDFLMSGAHGQLVFVSRRRGFVVGVQSYEDHLKLEQIVPEWFA